MSHAAHHLLTGQVVYEPPLTNMFTMQWFLTLFATCLPKQLVLRIWDSILLEGSEILLRTSLAIWRRLESHIERVDSADDFYSSMGQLTQEMLEYKLFDENELMDDIYNMARFPFPQLQELREKYTYNITPFTPTLPTDGGKHGKKKSKGKPQKVSSLWKFFTDYEVERQGEGDASEEVDEEEMRQALDCYSGKVTLETPITSRRGKGKSGESSEKASPASSPSHGQLRALSPGTTITTLPSTESILAERMSTDMRALRMQYSKLRERQKQAHIIILKAGASQSKSPSHGSNSRRSKLKRNPLSSPDIINPTPINHLFLPRNQDVRNRNKRVAAAPSFTSMAYANGARWNAKLHQQTQKANRSKSITTLCHSTSHDEQTCANAAGESASSDVDSERSTTTVMSRRCGSDCSGSITSDTEVETENSDILQVEADLVGLALMALWNSSVDQQPEICVPNCEEVRLQDAENEKTGLCSEQMSINLESRENRTSSSTSQTSSDTYSDSSETVKSVKESRTERSKDVNHRSKSHSESLPSKPFNPFPTQKLRTSRLSSSTGTRSKGSRGSVSRNNMVASVEDDSSTPKSARDEDVPTIGRTQINQCLHRHYLAAGMKHGTCP